MNSYRALITDQHNRNPEQSKDVEKGIPPLTLTLNMRPPVTPSLLFAILLSSTPSVLADVLFVSPAPGASVTGGSTFTVTWKDSGAAPAIVDLTTYELQLYSGSNAQPQPLIPLKAAAFSAGNSVTITVPVNAGGAGKNV